MPRTDELLKLKSDLYASNILRGPSGPHRTPKKKGPGPGGTTFVNDQAAITLRENLPIMLDVSALDALIGQETVRLDGQLDEALGRRTACRASSITLNEADDMLDNSHLIAMAYDYQADSFDYVPPPAHAAATNGDEQLPQPQHQFSTLDLFDENYLRADSLVTSRRKQVTIVLPVPTPPHPPTREPFRAIDANRSEREARETNAQFDMQPPLTATVMDESDQFAAPMPPPQVDEAPLFQDTMIMAQVETTSAVTEVTPSPFT
jgi:hypothetical protein